MPKVASEVKVQAHPSIRLQNRPSDKSDNTPFASLLDPIAPHDRPAAKTDRTDQAKPARKSDPADTKTKPSDDAPAAQSDSAPASNDTPAPDKTEGKTDDTSTATADAAPSDTKDSVDAGIAAAIDAAVQVTPSPQIVQAAVVAAPVIAPVDAPPVTDAATADISAPVAVDTNAARSSAPQPADTASLATATPDDVKAATPITDTGKTEQSKSAADPSPLQKQPQDGSQVKSELHSKEAAQNPAEPPEAAPKQAKPEHADTDTLTKPLQPTTNAPDTQPPFTLSSLHPHAASANATVTAAPAQAVNAVPLTGIAVEIATQAHAGGNRFQIRLDPPELGRIDVRLDVDKNGQVTTHLRVDRVETLDMLRRDATNLERTLQDAGLKTSGNALNFSLRDQSPQQQQTNDQNAPSAQHYLVGDDTSLPVGGAQVSPWTTRLGGLDIRV